MARQQKPLTTRLPIRLIANLMLPDGDVMLSGSIVSVVTTWTAGAGVLGLLPTRTVRYSAGAGPWQQQDATVSVESLEAATGKDRMRLV